MAEHLAPPWTTLWKMMDKLFEQDPEVTVKFDEDTYTINVFVENQRKADALTRLLPETREFGNITVHINVVPANEKEPTKIELFQRAFDGNDSVCTIYTECGPNQDISYIAFEPMVVQFFNDQLDDINGLKSTLYADIAREVFGDQDLIFFCTEALDESMEIPLGEWP